MFVECKHYILFILIYHHYRHALQGLSSALTYSVTPLPSLSTLNLCYC